MAPCTPLCLPCNPAAFSQELEDMEEMNLTLPHRGKLSPPPAPGGVGAGATEQVAVWPLGSEPGWPWLLPGRL